ncbi:hypothetical protein HQ571_05420 [Candidatus Kuenenbacteria bacterium]|nr:hypothetical protein [Candidatus Kuenenbacteria bacterium]
MANRIFAITGTDVVNNGLVSFKFMFDSGAPPNKILTYGEWGTLHLRDKGDDEIDPFKLVRGEPGAVGPDGVQKWQFNLFKSGTGSTLTAHVEEAPDEEEKGLQSILKEANNCVVLMKRGEFDRFEVACLAAGIEMDCHHFDGSLSTS